MIEPGSFWRGNEVAVVILLRVLARMPYSDGNNFNCLKFYHNCVREIYGLTSFNKKTVLTFLVKKRYNETFRGVDFLRIWEKTLNHLFLVVVVLEIPQNPRVDIFLRQEKALKDSKRRLFFCSMKCLHYCLFNLSRRDRVVKSAFLTWKFCREIQFFLCQTKMKVNVE